MRTSIAASIFSILVLLRCSAAQASSLDALRLGDNLGSSSRLVSANTNFSLGFHTPQNSNNSYLAVWYSSEVWYTGEKSSETLPVWIGNRENPFLPNSNPNLAIDASGRLVVTHGGGSFEVYSGGPGNNFSATLLDTGNFVVIKSGEIVWQSFDFPTDVLLPGMRLGFNHGANMNWMLSSWFDDSNPAPGAFTLQWVGGRLLQSFDFPTDVLLPGMRLGFNHGANMNWMLSSWFDDSNPAPGAFTLQWVGGRLLIRRNGVLYWGSGQMTDYSFQSFDNINISVKQFENIQLPDTTDYNYNITNVTNSNEEYLLFALFHDRWTLPDRRFLSNWKLDFNGDLLMIQSSMFFGIGPSSDCYGYRTKATTIGCQLWDQPTCRNERQTFVLRAGAFGPTNIAIYDNNPSLGPSDCRKICWDDCQCVGYNHFVSFGCAYWRGRNVAFVKALDGNANTYYVLDTKSSRKGMKRRVTIIFCVLSAAVLLVLCLTLFVMRKLRQGKRDEELHNLLTLDGYTFENGRGKSSDLKLFTYASIQSATSNFSSDNKLGQGGFGPVYKGRTSEGQEIAVKVLSRQSGQGLLEFKTELILISKLQHVNLVKLVGFCVHGDDKMIIYDYMPNKSLDFFLFSQSGREQLNWQKRLSIIEGIAQGLLYLHKYSRVKIIHRDLKPGNILLDQNMNPKISDFGLARIFKHGICEANTNRRVGTYGYMAPEYAMQGIFSVKSDVYSFGVLILEIVTGQKNASFHKIGGPLSLVEYAWELWRKDLSSELMDPTLLDSCDVDQLQRFVCIGLLCVENHATDRPTIEDVILMLKSETMNMPMPLSPGFITRKGVMEVVMGKSENVSANEVTISEIEGR